MRESRLDGQLLARRYKHSELCVLDSGKESHARETIAGPTISQPEVCAMASISVYSISESGEMAFENCADGGIAVGDFEVDDAIDQLKVLKTHVTRAYAPLAATSSSTRALRF